MARIEKTVFISYRRTDVYTALAVYENLKNQGYDVFFDYRSISSGDFEQIITSNIRARAHFLLILTPTALDRCNEPGDWLRREIELAIDEKRNIIPLFFKGFRFGDPAVAEMLTGKLGYLSRYNGLNIHEDYFDEAMHRLRMQYLNVPLNTVLHPVSTEVQKLVREEQVAADQALEQIENVQELVKQIDEKPEAPQAKPIPRRKRSVVNIFASKKDNESEGNTVFPNVTFKLKDVKNNIVLLLEEIRKSMTSVAPNFRLIGGFAGIVLIFAFLLWSGVKNEFQNPLTPDPTLGSVVIASRTLQALATYTLSSTSIPISPTATFTVQPTKTNAPQTTNIPISPTSAFSIGSTMTGKDGMTLLYVPAGHFTMGSEQGYDTLIHDVTLSAFWIDRTEVTNKMYALCVNAGVCKAPIRTGTWSHSSYYGNKAYNNYPVVYVDWNMAKTYCEWSGRRLPTEAEWEKAARGTDQRNYPWGNEKPNRNLLNLAEIYTTGDTKEVGSFPKGSSPYGALDMAGNVWEWVADWYSETYYANAPSINPPGPDSGRYRVLRGGDWRYSGNNVHSWFRGKNDPSTSYGDLGGFRCAMSATP